MKKKKEIDNLIKSTKGKLIVVIFALVLTIVVKIVSLSHQRIISHELFFGRVVTQVTFTTITTIYLVLKTMEYVKILRNEECARNLLIKKNDERNSFIDSRVYTLQMKITLYCLSIAIVVTGFFEIPYAFFTLLTVLILISISTIVLNIYFRKKY